MKEELLIPKYDIVFQTLFSRLNERITKAFISDILEMKIEKINLNVDKNLVRRYAEEKLGVLDLRAELNNGIQCNIEIQLAQYENILERFLSYWARIYTESLRIGDTYSKLKRTICVFIVDGKIDEFREIIKSHTKWQIREEENKETILTKDLELHIIELPKALEEYKRDPQNVVMQWMKFLDNPNDMEVQNIMKENDDIKKAGEKLEEISSDETLRRLAELREKGKRDELAALEYAKKRGTEQGRKEGIECGKQEKAKEIAKLMIQKNMDIETIKEITKLTKEEIEKLK